MNYLILLAMTLAVLGNIAFSIIVFIQYLDRQSIEEIPTERRLMLQLRYTIAWLTNIIAVVVLIMGYKNELILIHSTLHMVLTTVFIILGSLFFVSLIPKNMFSYLTKKPDATKFVKMIKMHEEKKKSAWF